MDPKIIKCALCRGKHTAWSRACPKRKTILTKISTAKKELLMHPYFPEKVTITLGVSGWATRSDKGRQPRQNTEEAIDIDTEMDETIEDNTAGEPERQSRPLQTNALDFNFNPNSSGIESSDYNFAAQEVPRILNTRIFEDKVEASSLIQQSTQTAMAVPKSIQYLETRKRKKTTLRNTA